MPDAIPHHEPDAAPPTFGGRRVELRVRGRTVAAGAVRREGQAVALLHEAADILTREALEREAAAGRASPCAAGCAACCRQLVPVAPAEARMLRRLVGAMDGPRRERVETRFAAARRALERTGLLELLEDPAGVPPDGAVPLGRQYFEERVACPFLEEERCSIYESRPTACRQHAVVSPAAECAKPAGRVRTLQVGGGQSINAAMSAAEGRAWVPLVCVLAADLGEGNEAAPWLRRAWESAGGGAYAAAWPERR